MSTLDEVAKTLRNVLTDTNGFATPIVLTDPNGQTYELSGLWQDIGLFIDPQTGVAVHGRKASVALPIADLIEANLNIPENVPDEDERPWLVTWTPTTGSTQTLKVVGTTPDKLGVVVLDLVAYRS